MGKDRADLDRLASWGHCRNVESWATTDEVRASAVRGELHASLQHGDHP